MRPSTLRSKATAEDGWRSLRETPLFELNGYTKLARCQKSSSRRKEAHFVLCRREREKGGKEDKPLPCRSPSALYLLRSFSVRTTEPRYLGFYCGRRFLRLSGRMVEHHRSPITGPRA